MSSTSTSTTTTLTSTSTTSTTITTTTTLTSTSTTNSTTTTLSLDRYFVGEGEGESWNDSGNWSDESGGAGGAGVPTNVNPVYFDGASPTNCVLSGEGAACLTLSTVGYGHTLDLNDLDLIVEGSGTCTAGIISLGTGTLTFNNSIAGSTSIVGLDLIEETGTVYCRKTTSFSCSGVNSLANAFYNIMFADPGTTCSLTTSGGSYLLWANTFTINGGTLTSTVAKIFKFVGSGSEKTLINFVDGSDITCTNGDSPYHQISLWDTGGAWSGDIVGDCGSITGKLVWNIQISEVAANSCSVSQNCDIKAYKFSIVASEGGSMAWSTNGYDINNYWNDQDFSLYDTDTGIIDFDLTSGAGGDSDIHSARDILISGDGVTVTQDTSLWIADRHFKILNSAIWTKGTGKITLTGTGDLGSASNELGDIEIDSPGTVTMVDALVADAFTLDGNFSTANLAIGFLGTVTLIGGVFSPGSSVITVSGNLSNSGSCINHSTETWTCTGSGSTVDFGTDTIYNLILSTGAVGSLILGGGTVVTYFKIDGVFTIEPDQTIAFVAGEYYEANAIAWVGGSASDIILTAQELIINGGFDTDSNWDKLYGAVIESGVAKVKMDGGNQQKVCQEFATIIGLTYYLTFTIGDYDANVIVSSAEGTPLPEESYSPDTYSLTFIADWTTTKISFCGSTDDIATIDNVSIRAQWSLKVNDPSNLVTHVVVDNSDASSGYLIDATDGTNTNYGNNSNWRFTDLTSTSTSTSTTLTSTSTSISTSTTLTSTSTSTSTSTTLTSTSTSTTTTIQEYEVTITKSIVSTVVRFT